MKKLKVFELGKKGCVRWLKTIFFLISFFQILELKSQYISGDSILIIPDTFDVDLSKSKYLGSAFVYNLFNKNPTWYSQKRIQKAKEKEANIIKLVAINGELSNTIKLYYTDSLLKYVGLLEHKRTEFYRKQKLTDSLESIMPIDSIRSNSFQKYLALDFPAILVVAGIDIGVSYKAALGRTMSFGPFAEVGLGGGYLFYSVARVGLELDGKISKKKKMVLRAGTEWYISSAKTDYKSFNVPLRFDFGIETKKNKGNSRTYLIGIRKSDLLPWYIPCIVHKVSF
jgi:hypothetical protein